MKEDGHPKGAERKEINAALSAPFRLNPAQVNVMRHAVSEAMEKHRNK